MITRADKGLYDTHEMNMQTINYCGMFTLDIQDRD